MKRCYPLFLCALIIGCTPEPGISPAIMEHARALTQEYIIVDGHIDVPYRLSFLTEDVSGPTIGGDFDYPRAVEGGLNAPFMSIYIPSDRQQTPGAPFALADSLIDLVESIVDHAPEKFAIATSVSDVRAHKDLGIVSLPLGMENGAPIDSLSDLAYFHGRGIRYITLAHAQDNHISDSSYDSTGTWGGLSPFGLEVVDEMNRLGIMVDISHLTDSSAAQVLRRSQAPVVASHSSVRSFTPGWKRNMGDALIEQLAAGHGVIMISFGSSFLRNEYRQESVAMSQRVEAHLSESNIDPGSREGRLYREEARKSQPIGSVSDLVDHIDHIVELVGIDHVGLGSDYDGVMALPEGAQDVTSYPRIVAELIVRGYSDEDIRKILGENALRVWEDVEEVARTLQGNL